MRTNNRLGQTVLSREDTYTTFMMDHAAGNQPAAMALAGDLHMMLSQKGAEAAYIWSIIGGALLETGPSDDPAPGAEKRWRKPRRTADRAEDVIAMCDADLHWKRGLSGVSYAKTGTKHAKFMKLEPGEAAPLHGHSGLEATVVLHGQFTDGHAVYERGDLVLGEPGMRHKPAAVGDEACICFVAEVQKPFWRMF